MFDIDLFHPEKYALGAQKSKYITCDDLRPIAKKANCHGFDRKKHKK